MLGGAVLCHDVLLQKHVYQRHAGAVTICSQAAVSRMKYRIYMYTQMAIMQALMLLSDKPFTLVLVTTHIVVMQALL